MISEKVLRQGLAAMGEAYGRRVDVNTERVWSNALRDLSDEQFRFAVDAVIRTDRGFFPPPGVVLAAGYDMPRAADTVAPKFQIRGNDTFWASAAQAQLVQAVVLETPISQRELNGGVDGRLHYVRRIAIAAGLMTQDGAVASSLPKTST